MAIILEIEEMRPEVCSVTIDLLHIVGANSDLRKQSIGARIAGCRR